MSKSVGHSCMVYFWILSPISLDYLSILMPVPPDFDYYSFVDGLKLGTMSPLSLVFFGNILAI